MTPRRRMFSRRDLVLVARGEDFQDAREPALRIGDAVRLNSGGPRSLVVDECAGVVTLSWRDKAGKTHEHDFPRACVHRIRD